jgi:lipopolysaccharide exporter
MTSVNAKRALIHGAAWAIAMRWSIKGLGLVSTLTLARLLTPGDYGLVAMSMLVVGLVYAVSDFGVAAGLLRMPSIERDDIDSAWTLGVMQGIAVCSIIMVSTPLAARYFHEPRIVPILLIIAVCNVISSTCNIGLVVARKELNFSLEYRFNVIAKLLGVIVTISAAFVLRDYRALVLGVATGYIGGCILSYLMHPYRPRWNTSRIKAQWHFGRWIMVGGVGNYISRKTDEVLAGRVGGSHGLGIYSLGSELGQMATGELGPPMLKALLPVLASLQQDKERLRQVINQTLAALNTITLPAGVGLALVASSCVEIMLGNNWAASAQYVAIFALFGSVQIMMAPVQDLLIVKGFSRQSASVVWVEFSCFIVFSLLLIHYFGLVGLAYARLAATIISACVSFRLGVVYGDLHARDMLHALARPIAGCILMAGAIMLLGPRLAGILPLVALIAKILCGVAVYASWILISWLVSGKPAGLEASIVQTLKNRAASL